jgi:nitroreductase
METKIAIEKRRAIKQYNPDHQMTDDEINELLSLAILSPTAFNIQNWRFVLVRDAELRSKIRELAGDQAQITDASLLIILCADLKAWERDPARYWKGAPNDVQDYMVPATDAYYRNKDQVQRDEAMRSCGIAAQTLMLAAMSMGYESCPIIHFDFEKVAELINLPEDHVITMIMVIGKGTKDALPRSGRLALDEVVIQNSFK